MQDHCSVVLVLQEAACRRNPQPDLSMLEHPGRGLLPRDRAGNMGPVSAVLTLPNWEQVKSQFYVTLKAPRGGMLGMNTKDIAGSLQCILYPNHFFHFWYVRV